MWNDQSDCGGAGGRKQAGQKPDRIRGEEPFRGRLGLCCEIKKECKTENEDCPRRIEEESDTIDRRRNEGGPPVCRSAFESGKQYQKPGKVDDHCDTISDKDFFEAALILRKQRKQSQIEKCNGNQGIVVRISGTKRGDAENDPIGGFTGMKNVMECQIGR